MNVARFINEPVSSNCYVIYRSSKDGDCIVVDPGSRNDVELLTFLKENMLVPKYIVLTHEHFDHSWGVNALVEMYSIPIICSELCSINIKDEWLNCSAQYDDSFQFVITSKTISIESLQYKLQFLDEDLDFFKTPGHTEASICFTVGRYLFTGDTLIKDERTVTKLPTGSKERLKLSKDIYAQMEGKGYTVCPGHGEEFWLDGYDLQMMLDEKLTINRRDRIDSSMCF